MTSVPESVKTILDTFLNEIATSDGHRAHELHDPETATDRCYQASVRFQKFLQERDVGCKLIMLEGLRQPPLHNQIKSPDYDWMKFGHFVVFIGDTCVDWTARQIDHTTAFPYVTTVEDIFSNWAKVMTCHDAGHIDISAFDLTQT